MQGIDISNWQNGIDLSAVPCDFAICKATQGTSYVSPDCVRQVEQTMSLGKLFGVYHYVGGQGAVAEADFFVDSVLNWIGKGILVIDWESGENSAWGNLNYLDQLIKRVIERTGIPPIIYSSASDFPWDIAANNNCGTWVAQYANYNSTGYQDSPWNEGAYSCTIRQYASTGRLPGYCGNLDINKAYINAEQWMKYANPSGDASISAPAHQPTPSDGLSGDVTDLVAKVWQGEFGDGEDRKQALGSRYDEVQSMIDHIASASTQTLVDEVWAGKYGNGDKRKAVLNNRYDEVMAIINGNQTTIHRVQPGETLSGIAAQYGTTWQKLQQINGITNANIIYPGQVLTIG